MSELVFLAHLPLLRIDSESLHFASGDLWRMPFANFLGLTGGAFENHQTEYEETAPVFYRVLLDLELPSLTPGRADGTTAIEIKAPSDNWGLFAQFGMGYLERFQEALVDRAWAGLLLASPASALPAPRLSVTFVVSVDDAGFELGEKKANVVHIQGDADQEYLFFSKAAGTTLGDYIYAESIRLRQPTILRQTLLQQLRTEPEEQILPRDIERIIPFWRLLSNYDATCRDADIDRVLMMFRRAFSRRFVSGTGRSILLFSALEAMLGRFRAKREPLQLEDLVLKLTGPNSASGKWFAQRGRRFRNTVAHEGFPAGPASEEALDHVCNILRAVIPAYVRTWVGLSDRTGKNPGYELVGSLQTS